MPQPWVRWRLYLGGRTAVQAAGVGDEARCGTQQRQAGAGGDCLGAHVNIGLSIQNWSGKEQKHMKREGFLSASHVLSRSVGTK